MAINIRIQSIKEVLQVIRGEIDTDIIQEIIRQVKSQLLSRKISAEKVIETYIEQSALSTLSFQ